MNDTPNSFEVSYCHNAPILYKPESDDFYCSICDAAQGGEFYRTNKPRVATPPGVPEGWRLVPEELTDELRDEFWHIADGPGRTPDEWWAAALRALAAAPSPPVVQPCLSDDRVGEALERLLEMPAACTQDIEVVENIKRREVAQRALQSPRPIRGRRTGVNTERKERTLTIYRDDSTSQVVYERVKTFFWTANNTVLVISRFDAAEGEAHHYIHWPRERFCWFKDQPAKAAP